MAKRFVKLGPKAKSFADPYSRFKIRKGQVKELKGPAEINSGRIKMALNGGHLQIASTKEYEEYRESLESLGPLVSNKSPKISLADKLEEKTKGEMVEYYKANYEVTEDEVEAFKKLKHAEMVIELVELDKENEDFTEKEKKDE